MLGHDVLLAGDLEHALEIIEARAPEVVLAGLGPGAVAQLTQALDAIAVGAAVIAVADEVSTPTVLDAMRAGAVDLIGRPIDPDELQAALQRAENLLRSRDRAQRGAMEELREGIAREHMVAFMIGLANVIDAKSPYTREHSDRVAQRTKVFARYLNLPDAECERLAFGAKLHDIGKVAVPDAILDSSGALDKEQREVMQRHPSDGARILRPVQVLHEVIPIVERHHENWDGTGYPDRLRGEEIPFGARVVKLVDYFDAITSKRPYRTPLPDAEACKVVRSEAGRQLDPQLTEQFVQMVESGLLVKNNVSAVIPAEHRFAAR
ncbi:MAG TPA: HD domain-containing phosphohydrolase [Planctomycetota bacterium]|nr:HD domain-containing phosphohydrolase [Planctomycetota bacterium]